MSRSYRIKTSMVAIAIATMLSSGCNAQQDQATPEQRATNLAAAPVAAPIEPASGPWMVWRGPNGNGVVAGQTPPTTWSESENVIWKTEVDGRGHASPTVVGDQIILATSDVSAATQSVVSYSFKSGKENWSTTVSEGNFNPRIFPTNTHASSTVISDGELLFAVFNNDRSAQLTALDLNGNVVWQKKAADFVPKRYQFGFGSSPVLYEDTVIVCSECEQDGSMAAFNKKTGEEVWRVARSGATSYSTPAIAHVAGKQQLILSGDRSVVSYDPSNGAELWRVAGKWTVTCGTAVWSDDMVFVSGGFPVQQTLAIKADGSEEVVWENKVKFYEQSMIFYEGYLYGLADSGVCYCWRASDGEEMWKTRMEKKVSASPVLADGNIFITVESGKTFVFRANPEKFELVAENQLGSIAYPTPTIVENRILIRVAEGSGKTAQEWLYCIGSE